MPPKVEKVFIELEITEEILKVSQCFEDQFGYGGTPLLMLAINKFTKRRMTARYFNSAHQSVKLVPMSTICNPLMNTICNPLSDNYIHETIGTMYILSVSKYEETKFVKVPTSFRLEVIENVAWSELAR